MSVSPTFIVTGGAGFIGYNLVRALNRRGHTKITVVDNLNHAGKEQNLNRLEFRTYFDKSEFRRLILSKSVERVDCVFHIGACSSTLVTDESYLTDNNFQYSVDLCRWAHENDVRFVYASSAATYGDGALGYLDDEAKTGQLKPLNAYGRSKQMFDMWAIESGAVSKIAGLKYFNVYGPGEDHKGPMRSLVNKAYAQILSEGTMRLFKSHRAEYRDGAQERDFVYVDDAVAETLFFFDHPEISGLYNCGTGTARTWLDLANALFTAMNKQPSIVFVDMPTEIRANYQYHTQADLTKLRKSGYSAPFISIEDGVRKYVSDYLSLR